MLIRHIKSAIILGLVLIGICLIIFSVLGLSTYIKNDRMHELDSKKSSSISEPNIYQDSKEQIIIYKEGDNPEIDKIINEQIDSICNTTEFMWNIEKYDNGTYHTVGYEGEHKTSYINQTGIDFPYFKFSIMLYYFENPPQSSDTEFSTSIPLETHVVFEGKLKPSQEIPIVFSAQNSNYNAWIWTFQYSLPKDYLV